jgi:hypothetical protein
MYTGEMIDGLMDLVARAEEHAHAARIAEGAARTEQEFTSRFLYVPDAQPVMIGVA